MTLDDPAYIGQAHSLANELVIGMQAPKKFEQLISEFRAKPAPLSVKRIGVDPVHPATLAQRSKVEHIMSLDVSVKLGEAHSST